MRRSRDVAPRLLLCFALCGALGCRASVQGDARASSDGKSSGQGNAFADFDEQSIEDDRGDFGEFAVTPRSKDTGNAALLGARHDVVVKADAQGSSCRCLSVVVTGDPRDPRLSWESQIPSIDPARNLVVAFRSLDCSDTSTDGLGASYRGYRSTDDGGITVMVEAAKSGRPLITGAVIPRPGAGGQLLFEPFPTSLPYGKSLAGTGPCVVPH